MVLIWEFVVTSEELFEFPTRQARVTSRQIKYCFMTTRVISSHAACGLERIILQNSNCRLGGA
jgi:hypothetical protein